jgi:hypothetical protein
MESNRMATEQNTSSYALAYNIELSELYIIPGYPLPSYEELSEINNRLVIYTV